MTRPKLSPAALSKQLANKLTVAYAIVDRKTHRLRGFALSRREAYAKRRAMSQAASLTVKVVRIRVVV
jgi:hypothetical protein